MFSNNNIEYLTMTLTADSRLGNSLFDRSMTKKSKQAGTCLDFF